MLHRARWIAGVVLLFSADALAQESPPTPTPPTPPTPSAAEPPTPPPPPPNPPMPPMRPMPPMPPHGWGPRPPMPPGPPMMHAPGRVPVTVESGGVKNAVVERRVKVDESDGQTLFVVPQHSEIETWEQVCVAPCTTHLDRSSTYRVGDGNRVTQSTHFTLPPGADQVKLEIDPGNYYWHHIGMRLIGLGTAAAIVSGALLTVASKWEDEDSERNARIGGVVTGGIALLFLGVGIPLAILTQTHVKANDTKVAAPRLSPGGLVF